MERSRINTVVVRAVASLIGLCLAWDLLAARPTPSVPAPNAASGDSILVRASRVYRQTLRLFATARNLVRIPGAPLHEESQDYCCGRKPLRTCATRFA